MAKPKKIKDVMPAPEQRNLTHLALLLRKQAHGGHADKRDRRNRRDWRREQW
jgi:hypothetical protein